MIEQAWNYKSVVAKNSDNTEVGSVSKYAPRYFKIDWGKASEDWQYIFNGGYEGKESMFLVFRIASTMKSSSAEEGTTIAASQSFRPNSFSYNVLYIPDYIKNNLGINYNFCSFEQIIEVVNKLGIMMSDAPINLSMEGITEITEDEYYKID